MSRDPFQFLRSLPQASANLPTFDPSTVKTNLTPDQLNLALNTFSHFVWHEDSYKADIGRRILPLEFTVRKRDDGVVEAQTVFETKVTQGMSTSWCMKERRFVQGYLDMCNVFNALAGGGAALVVDGWAHHPTFSSPVT
jgi:hypothetical protein